MNQCDSDDYGKTRTGRIARQAQDAGEAAARRADAARRRGEAAGKRIAELRDWPGHPPGQSREAADRAAEAAECEGDITRAVEHRRAAARDRTAASDDHSPSQQTTAAHRRHGSAYDAE